jgi:Fibronectin type III-like domain
MKLFPAVRRRLPRMAAAAGFVAVAFPAILAAAGGLPPAAGEPASAASCPWLNRSLPAGPRVRMLLSQMTLADQVSMVTGAGAGNIAAIPGLCVPAISLQDGPNGVGDGLTGVTQLPAGVVSATVTNTGPVAGSDVAQLYLGDPAAAGEPPRQLEGFDKVTLTPGQSATVRFTLTGHDLSYWDDAANGWVLPDGRFQAYVGDSSALAGLPLRGGFTVTRTLGVLPGALAAPSPSPAGGY